MLRCHHSAGKCFVTIANIPTVTAHRKARCDAFAELSRALERSSAEVVAAEDAFVADPWLLPPVSDCKPRSATRSGY
jgi:hypothetical protein